MRDLKLFDASGNPIAGGSEILQRPQISAPDGIQTTFFGQVVGTEKLPSFFGTSGIASALAGTVTLTGRFRDLRIGPGDGRCPP